MKTVKLFKRQGTELQGELNIKTLSNGSICLMDLMYRVRETIGTDYTVIDWHVVQTGQRYAYLAQCRNECFFFDAIVQ